MRSHAVTKFLAKVSKTIFICQNDFLDPCPWPELRKNKPTQLWPVLPMGMKKCIAVIG